MLETQINASIWSMNRNSIRQHGDALRTPASEAVRACTRTWHGSALLYIHLILRQALPAANHAMVAKVAARVKTSLRILTEEELWVWFPKEFLLWVLCLVGTTEEGGEHTSEAIGPDRLWLLLMLSRLRNMMGLDTWEDGKAVVMQFAWVAHLCDVPCQAFWLESDAYVAIHKEVHGWKDLSEQAAVSVGF